MASEPLSREDALALVETLCASDDADAIDRAHARLQAAPNAEELGAFVVASGRVRALVARLRAAGIARRYPSTSSRRSCPPRTRTAAQAGPHRAGLRRRACAPSTGGAGTRTSS